MYQSPYESILSVGSIDELKRQLQKATSDLGFRTYTAFTYVPKSDGSYKHTIVHNTPEEFTDFFGDPHKPSVDPVMSHCRRSSIPLAWGRSLYLASGMSDAHDHMMAQGCESGVGTAFHLPNDVHFAFGLDMPGLLPQSSSDIQNIVANVQLLAVHVQDVFLRLSEQPPPVHTKTPHLTRRELEAMKWTMAGKTAWETGAILNISERTASLHIQNAMHKLGAVNKMQAVLKALQLGVIQ